ncbi:Clan SB, family S8, subtilisin-like serine peptidase [Trichomonas vaginalis G3]|uniref:Clan SB, family S8, subtilisin-like serine peptidase n=1 Tax=Trichomonas vaginalis (strain ATCC PRA-98 / G3) TaxID=412133 RepID=A2F5H0_TRIV3|nr:peptidases S8 Kp43 protease domain-containing protein [Trichomonas vaginalis G3]EAX99842.1 Clan SB, family S8, subtilisin-like serine peptidase [Trichomonas vaginalis G3]KAI5547682.1 peptidases S8 Kp43 protease domain-containing protein [Trichomonas vaginalis G3]|eukprot:XP_001312772.1 Clan SB, family S8, subtilisin-like serine peptidase [Trichomonas vaginalis G3]
MMYPQLYYSYLNHSEYHDFKTQSFLSIWCKNNTIKSRKLLTERENYLVVACENWDPPFTIQKLSNTLYFVNDLTDISLLENDLCVSTFKISPQLVLNNRYSTGYMLSHENSLIYDDMKGYVINRDLHSRGIEGQNQIITIGDTGVDYNHQFFLDPTQDIHTLVNKTNLNHRKIVRIEAFRDYSDYYDGHGTHVAGIALGEPYNSSLYSYQYKGVAPKAKLYMLDMGFANISRDLSALPDFNLVFSHMKELNSGIFSNSWGYNLYSREITQYFDSMAYDNPDILFIFSAGNVFGPMTIITPGDSKNIFTVGMTSKPSSNLFEYPVYRAYYITDGSGIKVPLVGTPNYSLPYFPLDEKLKTYIDIPLTVGSPSEGKAYFTTDDPCSELSKALAAKASIFLYTSELCPLDTPQNIVCARIEAQFASIVESWKKITICSDILVEYEVFSHPSSSQGPGYNGIFKPDISAPGYHIFSAKALSTGGTIDSLSQKTGTSMSAPLIAGVAALVRQYFMDGHYKGITKPSSSLIKATILNSAIQIDGSGLRSFYSGFGIPFLSRALGFKDLKAAFFDRVILKSGDFHTYQIKTSKQANLSISMSYLDRSTSNGYILFADFGIILETPAGEFISPNSKTNYAEESLSTNERILLTDAEAGVYRLYVYSNQYNEIYEEKYSIAILGGFSSSSSVKRISNSQNSIICPSNQYDDKGRCICNEGSRGFLCREKVETVPFNVSATKIMQAMQYSWFSFVTDKNTEYSVYLTDLSNGNFHSCICQSPELGPSCYCQMATYQTKIGRFYTEKVTKSYLAVCPISQTSPLTRIFIGKDLESNITQRLTITPNPTVSEVVNLVSSQSLTQKSTAVILVSGTLSALIVLVGVIVIVIVVKKKSIKVEAKDVNEDSNEEEEYEEEDDDTHEEDYSVSLMKSSSE